MGNIIEEYKVDIAHVRDFLPSATGDLDKISGLANVKNALFHRLVTSPGSLIHRPDYGVGIKDFQNAPSTLAVQRQLAARIQEQFERDPRVQEVTGVRIDFDTDRPEKTLVTVKVILKGYTEEALTFIPFGEDI